MRESILVVGAHPDDAEIGVGGTLAAYAARQHRALMVNVRVPGGHNDGCHETRSRRFDEATRAAGILGVEMITFGLERTDIRPNSRLVGVIERLLENVQPTEVYTHWVGDSHPEHVALTQAVLAATRHNRHSVFMYEATIPGGITEHSFRPQRFVDISNTIEEKMDSLASYETQVARYGPGWLEAVRGRAAHRGFQIGRAYAEAFEVVKQIAPIADLRT
jgi:LmbE family N-acetylglucosaminyl deacetylase